MTARNLARYILPFAAVLSGSPADAAVVEEVVVVAAPIRESQAAAIETKRAADNVLDIISADTIGRFPDQNLADSLGRLPGVAIERDQGQARYINFRGAPFRWTAIAFDGVDVPGAENGRVPRFDSFPSVITSAVTANKAITPDMPGEAVAGFIDIRTFSPFDIAGPALSVEGGVGEQDLGDGDVDKLNGRASWSGERFGVVAFASHNLREQVTDNRELELELNDAGRVIVNNLDFRNYRIQREDNAYGGTLEFRPNPSTRLFASTLFSEFIDEEQRNQWDFDFADEDNPGFGLTGLPLQPDAGYQPVVVVSRLLEDGRYRNYTRTSTLGADFDLDGWHTESRVSYTETGNTTFLPIPFSAGGVVAARYDVTDVEEPVLEVFQPGTTTRTDINTIAYAANLAIIFASDLDTQSVKFKLDAERDLALLSDDSTVKLGLQYDTREAEGGNVQAVTGLPGALDVGAFVTAERWDTDFDDSLGGRYHDNAGLRQAWESLAGGSLRVPFADDTLVAIEEDIVSAYGMLTHRLSWGNVVYGARFEHTDYSSDGPAIGVKFESDYLDVLPSVHVNFDLTSDLKLRLSGTTGLSRPTYQELRASAVVITADRTIVGGNPALNAENTWGFDASLEWYFAPASIASVAAYYRSVDDVIYADSTVIDGGLYVPADAGTPYTLIGFVNGDDGELTGLEFNFIGHATDLLPRPFDGFGISANLTLLDSEFETASGTRFSLPGTSDVVYNASLFYERYGVSARVNYMYRDDWLSTTENDNLAEYWAEQERVDLSVRYALPLPMLQQTAVTLFVNVNNLTDETDVRYAGTRRTPNQVEGYGRHYVVGVRADF